MACDAEDCGFQMLSNDEIVTSMQEESDPIDDETDEYEDNNNNGSSKDPSNAEAFSAVWFHILHESHSNFGYLSKCVFKQCTVPIDSDE
ncbi:hypothetical protein TNCV_477501 [Trichonephila clavipes]|nr:hypothetical protein TNCV_477501 [Trichonephila clavipes]